MTVHSPTLSKAAWKSSVQSGSGKRNKSDINSRIYFWNLKKNSKSIKHIKSIIITNSHKFKHFKIILSAIHLSANNTPPLWHFQANMK